MNTNLETAIYGKLSGSTLTGLISGRMYNNLAPDRTTYPYVVFKVYTYYPDRAFDREYSNYRVQFSGYSTSSSMSELNAIMAAIKALYDEQTLTVTGHTTVWMKLDSETQIVEEHTTPSGSETVTHNVQEYDILLKVN